MTPEAKKTKPRRRGKKRRDDFFDDLRDLETYELQDKLNDSKSNLRSIEAQVESLQSERQASIATVQAMRAALNQSGGISNERRDLLTQLRNRTAEINETKALRDDINEKVSPSTQLIEKLLKRTYGDLTTIREDPSRAPNLTREIQKFSFFFELVEMHKLKQRSDQAHTRFVELLRMQKETIKKLDSLNEEKADIKEQAGEENPRLKSKTISRKEERELNTKIENMLNNLRNRRKEAKSLRREIGRVEAFIRIRTEDEKRGRTVRKRISKLREHAAGGGSLSIEDMARILETGGLSQLTGSKETKRPSGRSADRRGGRKRTQARRGTARAHKRKES